MFRALKQIHKEHILSNVKDVWSLDFRHKLTCFDIIKKAEIPPKTNLHNKKNDLTKPL